MKIYRVLPEPGIDLDQTDPDFEESLAGWYEPITGHSIRANIVSSPGGSLTGTDSASTSLTNPLDRALVRVLRNQAEAVIVGAETVRREAVPVPSHGPLVVLSRTGALQGHRVSPRSLRKGGVLILTGPDVTDDPTQYFPVGTSHHHRLGESAAVRPELVRDFLRSEGYQRLLIEGGLKTLQQYVEAGLVDELALTLTGPPQVSNQPPLPWWKPSWGEWRAIQVATDSRKNLYFRFQRGE